MEVKMKKVLFLAIVLVLGLGLITPGFAFQWLIEMKPGEVISFHCRADYKEVKVTNLNLLKTLVEDPVIKTPQQADFYFQWLFDMTGCVEPPTQYPGESLQDYGDRLAEYFRAAIWSKTLIQPVVVECNEGYCNLINNTEETVSFPCNCLLPLFEE